MGSRKGTLGYRAEHARRAAKRRITKLENIIRDSNYGKSLREWAEGTKARIESAIQQTYRYNENGKLDRSRDDMAIARAITNLQEKTYEVAPNLRTTFTKAEERQNAFTQHQMNMASVKEKPSIYTKAQVSVFYRATQKIWEKAGVDVEDRNAAVLKYYNEERIQKGLPLITLDKIMEWIYENNFPIINAENIKDSLKKQDERMRQIQESLMEKQAEDGKTSPDKTPQQQIDAITDMLYDYLMTPKPEELG